jgi:tetratricopeptide (TPR) repeat protein
MHTFCVAALVTALAVAVSSCSGQTPSPRAPDRERAYRLNNIGVAHLEQHDYDAAAQSFVESLQVAPDLQIAKLNLAIAYFYAGKTDDAVRQAEAAAAAMPAMPHPHYMLGLLARSQNRVDDAVAAFTRVLQVDSTDVGTRTNLGQTYLQQRDYARARASFEQALAHEPSNVTAAYGLAMALTREGAAEKGRAALQRFEALRNSAYGTTYSETYLEQGRYAEALASTGAEPELVDPRPPEVTFTDVTAAVLPPGAPPAAGGGGIALFDADGDGDLDLLSARPGAVRFLRNGGGRFADATAEVKIPVGSAAQGVSGAVAGDYDNDGRPDLLLLRTGGYQLLRQRADGTFEDATRGAGLPVSREPARTAAFVDVDHDGDLDLFIGGVADPAAKNVLCRNNGNGTFTDITADARLAGHGGRAVAIAPADYDNRRDIDLLVAHDGAAPSLFRNMRDGTFRDVASEVGLPTIDRYSTVAADDVNKDGFTDFFFGRSNAAGILALSDGRGAFRVRPGPDDGAGVRQAQFADYDNDGLLDLMTLAADAVHVYRNLGDRWSAAMKVVHGAEDRPGLDPYQWLALGDLDGDGDTDVIAATEGGALRAWRNDGGNRHRSLSVRLHARVSNRSGAGAKIELRAGSLRQQRELSSVSPAIAPADVTFGLGTRTAPDVVRVLWPAGILQAETDLRGQMLTITELDRKPSSCPYLYTWNGSRFEFVTDFMGGGEIGYWLAPGVWNVPDPDEYVRIRSDQLAPRDGRYELRVTNELEEALFVDRLQLVAVDHPAGVEVFPNEGLRAPPPPFALTTTRHARPVVSAVDDHGHDVRRQLSTIDRAYPDDFERLDIRGYAAPHVLTLDLGADASRAVLLMTGWTDYAFSSDNLAAHQRGLALQPPVLQAREASGAWRTVIEDLGIPVGRPQTIVVDLRGRVQPAARHVRVLTNMRIYWDQVLVDTSGGGFPTRVTRLDPVEADLHRRGFSAETSPDGREPFRYDYGRVSGVSLWKVMIGRYTREGDVRALLRATDDMFAIARPGDEIALAFAAAAYPPLPDGWTRTFLLYADGFSKEMNLSSATPDRVDPLPFHAMRSYPYGPGEHYPRSPAHVDYQARYNTRVVGRMMPPLDAIVPKDRRP